MAPCPDHRLMSFHLRQQLEMPTFFSLEAWGYDELRDI